MVGWGSSVGRTLTLTVGLNCLHQLPAIVRVYGSSEGSYLKNYLVIFCMYVFRIFHRHLRRGDTRDAHNSSLQFLRRLWGEGGFSMGFYSHMLAANLCVMCFLCYDQSVYVLIFSSRLRRDNAPDGRGRVSVVSSLSIAGDITRVCCVLLLHLCILVLVLFGKIVATQFLPYQFGQYPRLLPIFLENL